MEAKICHSLCAASGAELTPFTAKQIDAVPLDAQVNVIYDVSVWTGISVDVKGVSAVPCNNTILANPLSAFLLAVSVHCRNMTHQN